MAARLDREDLIDGLRELVKRIGGAGITGASIHIVGGAALRIAYFDRPTTADIDARIQPVADIMPIVKRIGIERNWPSDWLNDKASMFIPDWGADVRWKPVFEDEHVSVFIAPIDALLAMKLLAGGSRPGRDTDDIVQLLRLNDISSPVEAEALFESFYPGDALTDRTVKLLERIYKIGLRARSEPLSPFTLG